MIRYATHEDWAAIESWRSAHFARISPRPVTGQRRLEDTTWLVVEKDGKPVAATSFDVLPADRLVVAHDLYAAEGHVLDGLKLGRLLEDLADNEGFELRARTDPENVAYFRLLLKRGFEVTSIELIRQPREISRVPF